MTPNGHLAEAISTLQGVIDAAPITPAEQTRPTPCHDFTVQQLGDHIIDTHNLLLVGAGGTAVDGADTLSDRHAAVAAAALAQWDRRGTEGSIDLGGNSLPAEFGLSLHTLEVYVHAWDLAEGLGRSFDPSADLTSAVWSMAHQIVSDDFRGDAGAPYGAAVTVADGAPLMERLIAHTGRHPHAATRSPRADA